MQKVGPRGIYFVTALLWLTAAVSCSKHTNPSRSDAPVAPGRMVSVTSMSVDIINLVNQIRETKHLPPLRLLQVASQEAIRHSQDMATKKVPFGHDGFKTRAVILANELNGSSATGENVATGRMTAKEVITAWLRSPAHRANIEGDFTYTGVGVARDNRGVYYYTQLFVKK
ncbi:MAG TPA: CAP domain-containing protein [Chitinophagaceae bacterium]|jgi:uncharacterized protein YkwD